MPKATIIATVIIFLQLVSACQTVQDAKDAKGEGGSAVYLADYDTLWKALPDIIDEAGLDVVSVDDKDATILATSSPGPFTYGENVAVFVYRVSPEQTRVEVVTKAVVTTNITSRVWDSFVFKAIDKDFERVPGSG